MKEMIIDGIDVYRAPRVLPDDCVVIDMHQLKPIPERMAPIMADLFRELDQAHAPLSGRRVACILAGRDEGYGGHTVERGPDDIVDAFEMALDRVPSADTEIYGIAVTGEGPMKEKHVMPSAKAYRRISELLLPQSSIVLVPPNNREECRIITEFAHQKAYRQRKPSVFEGKTYRECKREAIERTALCLQDCEFAAYLRLSGLAAGIHYYLTGSASGQAAPSFAIKPGVYNDLDIIAVSDMDKATAEALFESIAESQYGALQKESKIVHVPELARVLEGTRYFSEPEQISIDFFVAPTVEEAFFRQEYLESNFYHQLS